MKSPPAASLAEQRSAAARSRAEKPAPPPRRASIHKSAKKTHFFHRKALFDAPSEPPSALLMENPISRLEFSQRTPSQRSASPRSPQAFPPAAARFPKSARRSASARPAPVSSSVNEPSASANRLAALPAGAYPAAAAFLNQRGAQHQPAQRSSRVQTMPPASVQRLAALPAGASLRRRALS